MSWSDQAATLQLPFVKGKFVWYCPYYGWEHLCLLKAGWTERHCILADGEVLIKMVSP